MAFGKKGGDAPADDAPNDPTGWLLEDMTIAWSTNLTLAFNEPVNRDQSIFFESPAGPAYLLSDKTKMDARSGELIGRAAKGTLRPFDGVLALESKDFVHWSDQFYLMPVLDFVVQEPTGPVTGERTPVLVETAVKNATLPLTIALVRIA